MDEDRLNMEIRKFLKQLGVTSQREIEKAVREADAASRLAVAAPVAIAATVAIPALGMSPEVTGELSLD